MNKETTKQTKNLNPKWGFLRENRKKAEANGIDKVTGLHRTGLDDYLAVIFPEVNDWICDKEIGMLGGKRYKFRPDYRSETLKLIIEFDGTLHYKNPDSIIVDESRTDLYEKGGYKVVRIPFFIQLTNEVVKEMFGVDVQEELFPPEIASMSIAWKNTPAFMCNLGIERMARELLKFPQQLNVNMKALKDETDKYENGDRLSGYNLISKYI